MSLSTALRLLTHGEGSSYRRLRAWWEGRSYQGSQAAPAAMASFLAPALASAPVDLSNPWSPARLRLLAELWGEGFTSPGGETFAIELVKPVALNSAMSVLNLDAHLGAVARAVANSYQMWVNAFESNETLAHLGMKMSEDAGFAKRAPVEWCDHEALGERLKRDRRLYDCIFSKEGFYRIADKDRLFAAIYDGLKGNGQLIFTDYVLQESGVAPPEVTAWLEAEGNVPPLWSIAQVIECLNRFELDIRITEDMTQRYQQMVLEGWRAYVARMLRQKPEPAMLRAILRELEIWVRRMLALDRGGLRIYRVHAIKPESLKF